VDEDRPVECPVSKSNWKNIRSTLRLTNTYLPPKKATFTGREHGTKKGWTVQGKVHFNNLMYDVCTNREENGKKFDTLFFSSITKKYQKGKSTADDDCKENDGSAVGQTRVVCHSDDSILKLVQKMKLEQQEKLGNMQAPCQPPEEEWDPVVDLLSTDQSIWV
jgi:hypothetical protein